jgi:hypothetical protein
VELLGTDRKLNWKQDFDSLRVELPKEYHPTADFAAALNVTLA